MSVRVLIASPLEAQLVQRIQAVDARLTVVYRDDLLAPQRYPGDHHPPFRRSPVQAAEWASLLAEAEVLFDVDAPSYPNFRTRAPRVRWIQASSSGIGEWVRRLDIVDSPILVTNAAGIHSTPLAEFVVFSMLYFARNWVRLAAEQRAHRWERCAIDTLEGKTLGILGLGNVGRAVARLARPFGVRTIGMRRRPETGDAAAAGVDVLYKPDDLAALLAESDFLAVCVPHTSETVGLLGPAQIASLKRGGVLINIARGTVVDEAAMVEALRSGHLRGAALDVVAHEPLAADSPLWDLPNVLITPHSMSTSLDENERLTTLFCDNLRRYLAGQPLHNLIDKVRGY